MLAIHCCWLNTAIDYAYRTFGKSRINLVKAICYENYCIETYYKVLKRKVSNLLILVLFMT